MSKYGPIIWLEDDPDDQEMIEEAVKLVAPDRALHVFNSGEELLNYLRNTSEQPFIILSDVNLPRMNGLLVREEINKDEHLRRKAIPFIFFSTTAEEKDVRSAYDMTVQGFFKKGNKFDEMTSRLKCILEYWHDCKHPNSFDKKDSH